METAVYPQKSNEGRSIVKVGNPHLFLFRDRVFDKERWITTLCSQLRRCVPTCDRSHCLTPPPTVINTEKPT